MKGLKAHKKSDLIKWIIISVLLVAVVAMMGVMFTRINNVDKTKNLSWTSYTVGNIATSASGDIKVGDEIDSSYALRSNFIESKDFNKIDVKDNTNSKVQYRVCMYDKNKTYLGTTALGKADLSTCPTTSNGTVAFFRVVLEGTDSVNLFNMNSYINEVTVTVNR